MDNKFLFSIVIFVFVSYVLQAQTTSIPDANFEDYLETHDANGGLVALGDDTSLGDGIAGNSLVFTDRISTVVSLIISDLGITSLDGIEGFAAIEILICNGNSLSSINVSSNTNLKTLLCSSNQLLGVNVIANTALEVLDCSSNQIAAINVSNNVLLEELTISNNRLTAIDVSSNQELNFLSLSENQIANLDLSNNDKLEQLYCASNRLTGLSLANNTVLRNLDVSRNLLTTLDLSLINTLVCPDPQTDPETPCQSSSIIDVSTNQLASLNIANGYNDLIISFNSEDNPNLFCVQTDTGFTAPNTWIKDDWTYFGDIGCTDIYTYVPDDNFEQALIDLGLDDVLDNLVLKDNINGITDLNVSNLNISNLIGIEGFVALQTLNCSLNNLEELDVSNNGLLTNLNCSNNSLEHIDLPNTNNLDILYISNNLLSNLNLSNTTNLTSFNCSNNSIKTLDLSIHTLLTDLNCESNALELLNIKNGQNIILLNFTALTNPNLSCIETDTGIVPVGVTWDIDSTTSLSDNCGTYVPDDGFEQALIDAGLDTAPLDNYVDTGTINVETNLDLSLGNYNIVDLTGIQDFIALEVFNCSNNSIVLLDLTINTVLTSVDCSNNALEFVDLRNGTNNPDLVTFIASNNPNLFCVNVDDNVYSENAAGWDNTVSYNTDCDSNRYTLISDANFEQALIDLGIDDVLDGRVLTSNIEYLESLNVNNKGIESLEGIQAFQSLQELDCSNNYLSNLDVSNMVNLESLYCSSNFFLTTNTLNINGVLNITGTTNLRLLQCSGNLLEDLDISTNANLQELDCSINKIENLVLTTNILLEDLNCANNSLSDIDVSGLLVLETLNCSNNSLNSLTTITVNNSTLINLDCSNNDLNTLQIDNYLELIDLNCSYNSLTTLNTNNNTLLEIFNCSNNTINALNLDLNTNLLNLNASQNDLTVLNLVDKDDLEYLDINYNTIATIDLSSAFNLKYLYINNNNLDSIDLSLNPEFIAVDVSYNSLSDLILPNDLSQLKTLNCSNNVLENDLDLSALGTGICPAGASFCPDLISINVSNNQLYFVNIQNGINSEITSFSASNNPNLYCIQVDDVNAIGANWVKEATTDYSVDCKFGQTYVPDDGFEQALIDLGHDDVLDDYVLTDNIVVLLDLDISVGNYNVVDLTGIEDFIALQNLNCSNNNIANVDLAENINLTNLNISNNGFTTFDASLYETLQVLNCDFNQIIELDFSTNTALTSLSCASNALELLNIKNGQNAILTNLNAQNNPDLSCIETDTGTIPAGVTWLKDTATSFSIDCHFGETFVPDDGFEQALIDLGYDDVLDDYVITANIEILSALNISSNNIFDLTGIEDFTSLRNLFCNDNVLTNIDLNTNVLLENLNVSNNNLTTVDISVLPSLRVLNTSNNSIVQINLSSNVNLSNVNVSHNQLMALDISTLSNLERLNCSFNALEDINIVQNPNVIELFCQSNSVIDDKLNLQNGSNSILVNFNATDNPNLGCILVDDPFTVLTNANGDYNNWFKDATANYQTVCDDADNDGIANADDQCPGTPFGETVDLFGCPIISFPNNNFTILVTDETCLNVNNGKINISTLEYYNYQATLTGENFNRVYDFTTEIDILNLLAGTYSLCITIAENPDFQSCYNVVIKHPEGLSVVTGKSNDGKKVSFDLSGSSTYNIDFNGLTFTTSEPELTLSLENGKNNIKISTDLECQGIHEETIFVYDDMLVYPNPFQEVINVYLGSLEQESVSVNIYTYLGQLVYSKTVSKEESRNLNVNTNALYSGIYTVLVESSNGLSTFKIVKK